MTKPFCLIQDFHFSHSTVAALLGAPGAGTQQTLPEEPPRCSCALPAATPCISLSPDESHAITCFSSSATPASASVSFAELALCPLGHCQEASLLQQELLHPLAQVATLGCALPSGFSLLCPIHHTLLQHLLTHAGSWLPWSL